VGFEQDCLAARGAALRGSKEGPRVTRHQGRAHSTHGLPLKTRLGCGYAGCRSCGSSPDTDSGSLFGGARQIKGGKG
jgi:hypothetical protein